MQKLLLLNIHYALIERACHWYTKVADLISRGRCNW